MASPGRPTTHAEAVRYLTALGWTADEIARWPASDLVKQADDAWSLRQLNSRSSTAQTRDLLSWGGA